MKQMTKAQAIAFHDSKKWETWTNDQIVALQLYQEKLCIPFAVFHEAIEKVLKRPVWTHEFAGERGMKRLQDEYEGKRAKGTVADSFEFSREIVGDDSKIVVVKTP